jgi:RimJ/RimL family protein N-acetyltransferase
MPECLRVNGGVTLRRTTEASVPPIVAVVNANLDHLRPWMPWANGPITVETQGEWFRRVDALWAAGHEFTFVVCDSDDALIGAAGLHQRGGPGVLEIGYWVAADSCGKGIATAVAAGLSRAASSQPECRRIEIRCDEANARSAAIPRRLGYHLVDIEVRPPLAPGETTRQLVWAISPGAVKEWRATGSRPTS